MQFGRKDSILKYKLLYTALVLFIYLLGKNLPLYGIDLSAYANQTLDTAALLIQAISGDVYRRSVFALGISPYMMASILVQMVVAFRSADVRYLQNTVWIHDIFVVVHERVQKSLLLRLRSFGFFLFRLGHIARRRVEHGESQRADDRKQRDCNDTFGKGKAFFIQF